MTFSPVTLDLIYDLTTGIILLILFLSLLSLAGSVLFVELVTHFRLQYLLASLTCSLVLLAFHSWTMLLVAVFCAALNFIPILPYYLSTCQNRCSTRQINLKFLQANALKSNRNYLGLLTEVKRTNPDVVVVQEFTADWAANTTSLNQDYPHALLAPAPSGDGMAIFSKYPLVTKERLVLDSSTHVALRVEVAVEKTRITVLGLHPTTPITAWKFKNRNRQFQEAASIMRSTSGPRLLIGDLNATMWSPHFTKLLHESGLRDARRGFGIKPTWPVVLPGFLRLPIDHCLVSEEWVVQAVSTGVAKGSDHKTVLFELALPQLSN